MFRGKEHYDKPETALARLELESPICSGSANITNNPEDQNMAIKDQEINTSFGYTPSAGNENLGGWDTID